MPFSPLKLLIVLLTGKFEIIKLFKEIKPPTTLSLQSHHTTPQPTTSHHTPPHRTAPHHSTPYHHKSQHTTLHHATPRHTTTYQQDTLAYILSHLKKVTSHSDVNKMTSEQLGMCLGGPLICPPTSHSSPSPQLLHNHAQLLSCLLDIWQQDNSLLPTGG